MDIDGEVEVNGWHLRIEQKHENALRAGNLPIGQNRANRSVMDTGRFTVVLLGLNNRGEVTCMEVWKRGGDEPLRDCTQEDVRKFCSKWADFAENNKPPRPELTVQEIDNATAVREALRRPLDRPGNGYFRRVWRAFRNPISEAEIAAVMRNNLKVR